MPLHVNERKKHGEFGNAIYSMYILEYLWRYFSSSFGFCGKTELSRLYKGLYRVNSLCKIQCLWYFEKKRAQLTLGYFG